MTIGIILGYLLQNKMHIIKFVDPLTNITIYALLFLLGISVGTNQTIVSNLGTLGAVALLLMAGGVIGSVVLAFFVHKIFFIRDE